MLEALVNVLKDIPREIVVMLVAAAPLVELRGALPLGYFTFGMSLSKAYLLSVLGNLIPVVPLFFFFSPVSERLRRFKLWARFFDWFFNRTRQRAEIVQRYEALGLAIFVAVPLPMTGAWTGVIAATLFKIRFKYALLAIISGVISAGLIVSILCLLGMVSWELIR